MDNGTLTAKMNDMLLAERPELVKLKRLFPKGYALPASHVLHTVGPIIMWDVTEEDREALASCYTSCLELAEEKGLKSVVFCCISTGEFRFPNDEAAKIAVKTVDAFLQKHSAIERVVFNVFKDIDLSVYRSMLGKDIEA